METSDIVLTIVGAVFASTGLWTFVNNVYQNRTSKRSVEQSALLGLLHDRIYDLCRAYIKKGSISSDEYENLECLYKPYKGMGGNGTGERLWDEVNDLPIREEG